MPVTQRFVHGGLLLTVALLSLSLTVLILGGARRGVSDAGLPGSQAVSFSLPDSTGKLFSMQSTTGRISMLAFVDRDRSDLSNYAEDLRHIANLYADDKRIDLIGVHYTTVGSLLGPSGDRSQDLIKECPQLHVVTDVDGGIARAYRVSGPPVIIIIDPAGVIRGRVELQGDAQKRADAVLAATEIINNLRGGTLPLPAMSGSVTAR